MLSHQTYIAPTSKHETDTDQDGIVDLYSDPLAQVQTMCRVGFDSPQYLVMGNHWSIRFLWQSFIYNVYLASYGSNDIFVCYLMAVVPVFTGFEGFYGVDALFTT